MAEQFGSIREAHNQNVGARIYAVRLYMGEPEPIRLNSQERPKNGHKPRKTA